MTDPIVILEDDEFQKLFTDFQVDNRWRLFYARLACFILAKARVLRLPDAKAARALPVAVETQVDEIRMLKVENERLRSERADEIRMLKAENERLRAENTAAQQEIDRRTREVNNLRRECQDHVCTIGRLEGELRASEEDKRKLQSSCDEIGCALNEQADKLDKTREDRDLWRQRAEDLYKAIAKVMHGSLVESVPAFNFSDPMLSAWVWNLVCKWQEIQAVIAEITHQRDAARLDAAETKPIYVRIPLGVPPFIDHISRQNVIKILANYNIVVTQ